MFNRMMLCAALVAANGVAHAASWQEPLGPVRPVATVTGALSKSVGASLAKARLANVAESARLRSADATAAANDHFAQALALDGSTLVVGVWGNDSFGTDDLQGDGAIEVWLRSGSSWALQQRIEPADLAQGDAFGWSVAISGDTLAVGSPFADAGGVDAGAVYVYTRSAGVWSLQQKVTGSSVDGGDQLGVSVDLDGNTLIAGAKADETASVVSGAAYVFTRSGSVWSQQGRLTATGGLDGDAFGAAVRVSGDYAVIGAEYADTLAGEDAGAAYVFKRTTGTWSQQAALTSNAADVGGRFGHGVAIDGTTIAVSDHLRSNAAGRALVFTGADASWSVQQTLAASDGMNGDFFGHALSLVGDTLVVGAYQADLGTNTDRGAAYRYNRSGSVWTQVDKYLASDASTTAQTEHFGFDVALTPGTAAAGAPQDEVTIAGPTTLQDAGAAYVYHLGTPTTTIQIVNPTVVTYGQSVSFTAQVSGGTPTGNVEFRNGATVLATVPLNGSFVAATSLVLNAGSYSVAAYYLGDSNHTPSNSAATSVTVNKANTSMSLNTSGSPSTYGQNVTFTANISAGNVEANPVVGSIEFRDNGTLVATVPISSGSAAFVTNALTHDNGTAHPITATFVANANYNGSSAGPQQHVVNKATPTLTLNANPSPSLFGQSVAITGTLSGGLNPTGTITFFDGISLLGSNNVVSNVATRNTASLSVGTHSLQATYAGDANHDSATTAQPLSHDVLPASDVSVTKSNGTTFVQSGQETTYTLTVFNPANGVTVNGLLVNDTLNPAMFDVPNADWSCAPTGVCSPDSGTGNIANLPVSLTPGSAVTITVTVPVLLAAETGVSNTVTVTMPGNVGDPNLTNNTATDSDGSGLFNDGYETGPLAQ